MRRLAARGLIQKAQLKKGAIINPRDTWPRFDGGFSMEYVGATEEGRHEFTYAYSQGYQVSAVHDSGAGHDMDAVHGRRIHVAGCAGRSSATVVGSVTFFPHQYEPPSL